MKLLKTLVVYSLIFLWGLSMSAQTTYDNPEDNWTLDKNIKTGVLDNGLTYFIKPVKNSNQHVRMIFLVKVGSLNQQQHELNFAHHIEHLSFRPSANFPSGLKLPKPYHRSGYVSDSGHDFG